MSQLLRYHTDLSQRLARTIKAEPLWPLVLVRVAELLTLKAVLHTYPCGYRLPKLVLDNSKPLSSVLTLDWKRSPTPDKREWRGSGVRWGKHWLAGIVDPRDKSWSWVLSVLPWVQSKVFRVLSGGCVSRWSSGGSCSQHLQRWVCFSHKHE